MKKIVTIGAIAGVAAAGIGVFFGIKNRDKIINQLTSKNTLNDQVRNKVNEFLTANEDNEEVRNSGIKEYFDYGLDILNEAGVDCLVNIKIVYKTIIDILENQNILPENKCSILNDYLDDVFGVINIPNAVTKKYYDDSSEDNEWDSEEVVDFNETGWDDESDDGVEEEPEEDETVEDTQTPDNATSKTYEDIIDSVLNKDTVSDDSNHRGISWTSKDVSEEPAVDVTKKASEYIKKANSKTTEEIIDGVLNKDTDSDS